MRLSETALKLFPENSTTLWATGLVCIWTAISPSTWGSPRSPWPRNWPHEFSNLLKFYSYFQIVRNPLRVENIRFYKFLFFFNYRIENSLSLEKFWIIGAVLWDSSKIIFPQFAVALTYSATLRMIHDNTRNLAITPLFLGFKFSSWIPGSVDISCKFLDGPEQSARLGNIKL